MIYEVRSGSNIEATAVIDHRDVEDSVLSLYPNVYSSRLGVLSSIGYCLSDDLEGDSLRSFVPPNLTEIELDMSPVGD